MALPHHVQLHRRLPAGHRGDQGDPRGQARVDVHSLKSVWSTQRTERTASPYRNRLVANDFKSIGVAPDPAALAIRVGAVVGGGDLQYPDEGRGRQLGMKMTVAVRGVSDVVADALPGASDPDGHFALRQKVGADHDADPRDGDRRRGGRLASYGVVGFRGGHWFLLEDLRRAGGIPLRSTP